MQSYFSFSIFFLHINQTVVIKQRLDCCFVYIIPSQLEVKKKNIIKSMTLIPNVSSKCHGEIIKEIE
jgi:hypothetical protein